MKKFVDYYNLEELKISLINSKVSLSSMVAGILNDSPFKIFDRDNENKPSLINPGDYVKFYEIDSNEYSKLND